MKKKLPIILLGVILACVLVFGFLYANNDIGKTANSLEADHRFRQGEGVERRQIRRYQQGQHHQQHRPAVDRKTHRDLHYSLHSFPTRRSSDLTFKPSSIIFVEDVFLC